MKKVLGKMLKVNKKGGSFFINYMLFFLLGMVGWITIMTSVSLSDRSINKPLIRVVRSIGEEADESIIYEDNEDYDDDYDDHEEEGSLKKKLFGHGDRSESNRLGHRPHIPPNKNAILPYPVREDPFASTSDKMIHILLTLDQKMLVGLPTLINSVLSSAKMPVRFHIMWCAENSFMVHQYLSCFDIKGFKPEDLDVVDNVGTYMNAMFWKYLKLTGTIHKKLESCADLVRLQSHRIFPYLEKVLWLDVDMIAQGDVGEVWNLTLHDEWIMTARTQNDDPASVTYEYFVGRNLIAGRAFGFYKERYGKPLKPEAEAFNNGVALLNLRKWRDEDAYLQKEYEYWMQVALDLGVEVNKEKKPRFPWWFVGNQAIMWFTYQQNVANIPNPGWHCDGLGWKMREEVSVRRAERSKMLHWNGDKKPWLDETGPHYKLWAKHKPKQCNDKGLCTALNATANEKQTVFYKCVDQPASQVSKNNNNNNGQNNKNNNNGQNNNNNGQNNNNNGQNNNNNGQNNNNHGQNNNNNGQNNNNNGQNNNKGGNNQKGSYNQAQVNRGNNNNQINQNNNGNGKNVFHG